MILGNLRILIIYLLDEACFKTCCFLLFYTGFAITVIVLPWLANLCEGLALRNIGFLI